MTYLELVKTGAEDEALLLLRSVKLNRESAGQASYLKLEDEGFMGELPLN